MMLNSKLNACIFVIFFTIFKFEEVWAENIEFKVLEDVKIEKCENLTIAMQKLSEEVQQLRHQISPRPAIAESCESAMRTTEIDNLIFTLNISGSELAPFEANCQRIQGRIWTIIQRRRDGTVDFARNWTDYKNGFGDLDGEFWLGLDRIHELTKHGRHELKIWMGNVRKETLAAYARYKNFSIGDETAKYQIRFDDFTGLVYDSLSVSKEAYFSTPDRDNDGNKNRACAVEQQSGWWFDKIDCGDTNLNGVYNVDDGNKKGIYWYRFAEQLKYTQMAIRRMN